MSESTILASPPNSIPQFRNILDACINSIKYLNPSREISLAHTQLQRAFMWQGKALGAAGGETPYKESLNAKSPIIEPTADHLDNNNLTARWDLIETTQTARVKDFRGLIVDIVKWFKDFIKNSESAGPDHDLYLLQSRLALEEANMWFGWELARIKKDKEPKNDTGITSLPLPL